MLFIPLDVPCFLRVEGTEMWAPGHGNARYNPRVGEAQQSHSGTNYSAQRFGTSWCILVSSSPDNYCLNNYTKMNLNE